MLNKKYKPTAGFLYFGTIMMGISMSILAQYKNDFATLWHTDLSGVLNVIGAAGLGGIIAALITGRLSDKFGRKSSAIIGHVIQSVYYFGLLLAPNVTTAYIFAAVGGGLGNGFINAGCSPTLIEIFPKNSSVANLMTKFMISVGQFLLPIFLLTANATGVGYRGVFITAGIIYLILACILAFLPFPKPGEDVKGVSHTQHNEKRRISLGTVALILIGYTSTAVFFLWLNTYQELALQYGIKQPSILQSIYAVAAAVSVLINSIIVKKGVKESTILTWYPVFSGLALVLALTIHQGIILYIVSALIGFFAAGGLFQLAAALLAKMYPELKATAMAAAGFMSMLANMTILSIASVIIKNAGANGQAGILILNIVICIIGALLGLIVKKEENNLRIND